MRPPQPPPSLQPPTVPAHEGIRLLKQQLDRAAALLVDEAAGEDDFRNWRAATSQVLAEALGEDHDLAASVRVAGPRRLLAAGADRRRTQRARLQAQARALEPCIEHLEREALRQARRAAAATGAAPRPGARVCRLGHVVAPGDEPAPGAPGSRRCTRCGSETVDACPRCGEPIRAKRRTALITLSDNRPPAYCQGCGAPLPWTEARLEALSELLDLSAAPEDQRRALRDCAAALMAGSPRTPVAVELWRRFLAGAGAPLAGGFRDLLSEIAPEAVKQQLA
jgi:hypothetical protein